MAVLCTAPSEDCACAAFKISSASILMSEIDPGILFPPDDTVLADRVVQMEHMQVTVGLISVLASLVVTSTAVLFPTMWMSKIYMKMIVMVSLSDAFAALALSFGFPTGAMCSIQGTMLFFFYRSSWMWSCLMLFQLLYVVQHARIYFSFESMNYFVWGTNLILTLLPLSTGTWYGESATFRDRSICTLNIFGPYYYTWILEGFIVPLAITTVVLCVLTVMLYSKLRHLCSNFNKNLVGSLILYPTMTLFTASPLLYFFIYHYGVYPTAQGNPPNIFIIQYTHAQLVYAWMGMQGFFNCIIFFCNSTEARMRWKHILRYLFLRCCGYQQNQYKKDSHNRNSNSYETDSNSICSVNNSERSDSMRWDDGPDMGDNMSLIGPESDFLADDELVITIKRENQLHQSDVDAAKRRSDINTTDNVSVNSNTARSSAGMGSSSVTIGNGTVPLPIISRLSVGMEISYGGGGDRIHSNDII